MVCTSPYIYPLRIFLAPGRRRAMCDSIQTRPAHAIKLKSGMQKGFDMNRDTVEGSWKELSGKVQEGYGITKDAAEQQIERLEKRTGE
jgi:uncharacterized protein YjbJ (UPF0337 family)